MDTNTLDRPLISVHFPKASGSSFRAALVAAFGQSAVLGSYDCDPLDPANPMWIYPDWFLWRRPRNVKPYTVVHGHLPIIKYDLLPSAYRVVTLREPVENLISIYYYWKSIFDTDFKAHAVFEFAKSHRLSLLEVAEIPCMRRLMSRTYFGGYDMGRFDVIGTHDNRIAFVNAVANLIGVPLSAEIRENVTPPSEERDNVLADAKVNAKLRHLLQDDIRLYEFCAEGLGGRQRFFPSRRLFSLWSSSIRNAGTRDRPRPTDLSRRIKDAEFRSVATLEELVDSRGPALLQVQAADDRVPEVAPLWLDAPKMIVDAHEAPTKTEAVALASFSGVIVSGSSLVGSETAVLDLGSPLMPGYVSHYLKAGWVDGATEPLSEKGMRHFPGASVLLTHFNSGVYGHWLLEGLPKLMLIRWLAQRLPSLSIVLPSSAPPFVRAWCEFLTPKNLIITYDDKAEFVRCEKLFVPGLLCSRDYVFHPLMEALVHDTVEAAGSDAEVAPSALFLTRIEQSHYRLMENHDEVEAIARSVGLNPISPETLSVPGQVRLFAAARLVVGEYGSALHNVIFSGPATVLGLNWINNCQSRIAQLRRQRLAYLLPESGPVTYERDLGNVQRAYRIDPGAFASALDKAQNDSCNARTSNVGRGGALTP